jgi:signal transduction histidine kinase
MAPEAQEALLAWRYHAPMRRVAGAIGRVRSALLNLPPAAADIALSVLLVGIGALNVYVHLPANGQPMSGPDQLRAMLLLCASAALLAARRRRLAAAFFGTQAIALAALVTNTYFLLGVSGFLVELILLYTVAVRCPPSTSVAALLWMMALDAATYQAVGYPPHSALYFDFPVIYLFWFAGAVQRRRQVVAERLVRRKADVEEERERLAGQAVIAERARIAVDMRGIVMQGVESMTRAGRRACDNLERAPDAAIVAIQEIEVAGRRVLIDLRRLLGLLRENREPEPVPPITEPVSRPRRDPVAASSPRSMESGLETEYEDSSRLRGSRAAVDRWMELVADRVGSVPWLVDVTIVAALTALMALNYADAHGQWKPLEPVFAIIILAALLFRRRFPIVVLVSIATADLIWILYGVYSPVADVVLLVAVYTAAASRAGGWGIAAAGLGLIAYPPLLFHVTYCACFFYFLVQFVLMTMAGRAALARRGLIAELTAQTDVLLATRAERMRTAAEAERLRVAREMHDIVAHGVTVMVMQAGLARMLVPTEPARAAAALALVDRLGTDAMAELRPLVAAPYHGVTGDWLRPDSLGAPYLAEGYSIEAVVERESAAGGRVELREEGDERPADPGLEASISRIVQEALTNARKHAPGARATVTVRYTADAVEVQVYDSGPSEAGAPFGTGHGLIGIRERAAAFGGQAEAGPDADGGFRVWARLPTGLVSA